MMSGIRGRNTAPEVALRQGMHKEGFRFRLHTRRLSGMPDLVFPKYRAAVFVHGCFWHRHSNCLFCTTPATNATFWRDKFAGNVLRDRRNIKELQAAGWRTAIVWECEIKEKPTLVVRRLGKWLKSAANNIELSPKRASLRNGKRVGRRVAHEPTPRTC